MQAREAPVVVICDDLGAPPVQLDLGELAERVCRQAPGTRVKVVPGSCQGPKALAGALGGIRPQRVVVGCRHAFDRRGELLCSLRRAGVARGGIEIVDLRPAEVQGGQAVVEEISLQQSAVLLRAAVARVTAVRLDVPVRERTGFSAGAISRRSLFGASNVARQAVAVFLPGSCGGGAACAACVLACPQQALSRDAGRVVVSADRCSGCGACVTACRNGAFSLPDADLDGLEAAFGVLVSEIWRGGAARGIAVACQQSKSAPGLGRQWLVLRVPSLQMVTAGWLLRLVVAGVDARVAACEESSCATRAGELEAFVRVLGEVLGFSTDGSDGGPLAGLAAIGEAPVELREPAASAQSLMALGALQPTRERWRVTGPGCSLGAVEVDLAACTLCEVCARACPTGALAAERDGIGSRCLSLDPRCCTACGACVAWCPEGAMHVERCADGALLAAGRYQLATASPVSCDVCGAALVAALAPGALARLGGAHPFLVPGAGRICANCRLGGRSVSRGRVG